MARPRLAALLVALLAASPLPALAEEPPASPPDDPGTPPDDPGTPSDEPESPSEDVPVLPARSLRSLLGDVSPVPGLELPGGGDLAMWDGTLEQLARAVGELGGPAVTLGEGVRGDTAVSIATHLPLPAARAAEVLAVAAERAGYEVQRPAPWRIARPEGAVIREEVFVGVMPHLGDPGDLASSLFADTGSGTLIRHVPARDITLMALTPEDMSSVLDGLGGLSGDPPAPEDRGVVEDPPGHYRVPREGLADLLEQPFRAATLRPRGGRGGSDEGFLLARVQRHGPLYALGLRDGDVLTARDGVPLDTIPDVEAALRALMTAEAVTLTLLRDGAPRDLAYALEGPPLAVPPLWGVDEPTRDEWRAHHGIEIAGRGEAVVPRAYVLGLRATLPRQLRWHYALDGDGAVLGVRGSGRDGDLLTLVGIRGSQVIHAVDGRPIVDPASLMQLFTALRTQEQVVLTLEGRVRPETVTIRVTGEPDPDPEPWPRALLTIPDTRAEQRAARGIEVTDDAVVFPRAVVAELYLQEATFRPTHDDHERSTGYRWIGTGYGDVPDLLGLAPGTTIRTLDGEPFVADGDVHALFEAWMTASELTLGVVTRAGTEATLRHRIVGDPVAPPATWLGTGIEIEPSLHQRRLERGVHGEAGQFAVPARFADDLAVEVTGLRQRRDGEGNVSYLLLRVENRSAWFVLGLQAGDRIVGCNGAPLDGRGDLAAAVETLRAGAPLTLEVERGGEARVVELQPYAEE